MLTKLTLELNHEKKKLEGLVKSAKSILIGKTFKETAREIFDTCCEVIGATSGYVALLNDAGDENEVLFLEAGGLSCSVDPNLPMPIRGLRADSYKLKKSVYNNDFMNSDWVKFMPGGHVYLKNVLFAPLIDTESSTAVGLLGLANKETDFTDEDAEIADVFGCLASIALINSRAFDKLREALRNIRTLEGLLPICASCKKIRDESGNWSHLEKYIGDNSNATFTHGLCPECIKKLYPELG